MNIPKYRKSAASNTHEDHWKSFTDVFATVCLMFFFVLVIFGVLSSYLGNQAQAMQEEITQKQHELYLQEQAWLRAIGELDESRLQLFEAEMALLAQEEELEKYRYAFLLEQERSITNMNIARENFESIAMHRVEMYKKIETMLKEFLGNDVYYDEEAGSLAINTNFLFGVNSSDVSESSRVVINQIKGVLFQIIDEYTNPRSDNLVRFEAFVILGHTDMQGGGVMNRGLSLRRAQSIVDLFLPEGSAEEAKYGQYFLASGASKFMPKEGTVTNQTETQMASNRRVEIIINFDDKEIEKAISDIANTLLTGGFENLNINGDGDDDIDEPVLPRED